MGAGLILYANAFGHRRIHRFFSFKTFTVMSSSALMVYAFKRLFLFMGQTTWSRVFLWEGRETSSAQA